MNDAEADKLVDQSVPVYYITGTIHSPETGSPTALMELVYRLAVDESPYIQKIRSRMVTLVTPIVEVDGRDRQVDIYRWHLANPGKNWPSTLYWGKYVAHDNNRDAMALTLNLTRNVLNTYIELEGAGAARPARVGRLPLRQHGRRRSVQRVARSDPHRRVADDRLEQRLGDDQVRHARRLHARHVRHLDARLSDVHRRHAQRHQPALRDVRQRRRRHARAHARPERHGAHLVQAESAAAEGEVVAAKQQQLSADGPARLAQPLRRQQEPVPQELLSEEQAIDPQAEDRRAGGVRVSGRRSAAGPQADLLRILQLQGCEISRATAPFTVTIPGRQAARACDSRTTRPAQRSQRSGRATASRDRIGQRQEKPSGAAPAEPETRTFPAGTTCCAWTSPTAGSPTRCSTIRYWAPDDPQRNPYDDTGWTFGELFNVKVVRVTDVEGARRGDGDGQGRADGAGRRQRRRAASSPSITTPTRRSPRCATGSRTRSSTWPRRRSRRPGRSSTAARSSSAAASAPRTSARRRPISG